MNKVLAIKFGDLLNDDLMHRIDALTNPERRVMNNLMNPTFDMLLARSNGIRFLKDMEAPNPEESVHKIQEIIREAFEVMEEKIGKEINEMEVVTDGKKS